jgi:GWxTD domain-containing protein
MSRRIITIAAFIIAANIFPAPCTGIASQDNSPSKAENAELSRLPAPYRYWLTEDVPYIITNNERAGFLRLADDDERDLFIEQFWQRRNPIPSSAENVYQEEYYRRIAYSNEHFSTDVPGWRTDRGRIYIMLGPPDEIRDDSGSGPHAAERWQLWRFRYLSGLGENVELKFVNVGVPGDFRLEAGAAVRTALTHMPETWQNESIHITGDVAPISGRFKTLEAFAMAHLSRNGVAFDDQVEFLPITYFTTCTELTIRIPRSELRPRSAQSGDARQLDLFCRILDARPRIVAMFGYEIRHPEAPGSLQDSAEFYSFSRELLLRPGAYDITIIVSDPKSGEVGTVYAKLDVPFMAKQN